jgi:hypothetical protein
MASSGRKTPRESSVDEAAQLDLLRRRAAERKGELASEEDMLRRERRNLMSAKKRAERGEADMVSKLERLEREVERLSSENIRLMNLSDESRRRVQELEAHSKVEEASTTKMTGEEDGASASASAAAASIGQQDGRYSPPISETEDRHQMQM